MAKLDLESQMPRGRKEDFLKGYAKGVPLVVEQLLYYYTLGFMPGQSNLFMSPRTEMESKGRKYGITSIVAGSIIFAKYNAASLLSRF